MRLTLKRSAFLPLALFAATLFASCAEADESRPSNEDASTSVPESGVADVGLGGDAGLEGVCDASDPSCVSSPISCDEAPWCLVPTTVSALYALTSLWGSGPNDVWAAGSGGTIVHWDGAAWVPTATKVHDTFHALWGSGPNDVWAVSMTNKIFHATGFEGSTTEWQAVPGAVEDWNAMPAFSLWGNAAGELRIGGRAAYAELPDEGFGLANQFVARRGGDGGLAWEPVAGTATVVDIWGTSSELWLIADNGETNSGELGTTLRGARDDAGTLAFTPVDSQSSSRLHGIWGSSGDDLWAVGDGGTIRRMKKGRAAWEVIASPTTEHLRAVWGSAADDIWAAGDNGTILHFDGTTWTPSLAAFAVGAKPDLRSVWGSSKNDVWIVGDNASFHYTGPKPTAPGGDR